MNFRQQMIITIIAAIFFYSVNPIGAEFRPIALLRLLIITPIPAKGLRVLPKQGLTIFITKEVFNKH